MNLVSWSISSIVIGFNIKLFIDHLDELNWPLYAVVFGALYFAFVAGLMVVPLNEPAKKEVDPEH